MLCNFLRCVLLKLARGARSSVYTDVGRACVGCSQLVAVPPLPAAGTRPEPAEPAGPPAPRGHPTAGMAGTAPPWSWGSRGQEQGQLPWVQPSHGENQAAFAARDPLALQGRGWNKNRCQDFHILRCAAPLFLFNTLM